MTAGSRPESPGPTGPARLPPELRDWVVSQRRWFHQHPEIGFEERGTQCRIIQLLGDLGIECESAGGTGVLADVRGSRPGPTVAIRADMDALSITEAETDRNRDYRSRNDGLMHACGHDGHMAMALGAARWFHEHRQDLCGAVRFIFQPAEEAHPGGALDMIAAGALDGVAAILCIHLHGGGDVGTFFYRPGPMLASSRKFTVRFFGKSGHHMCPEKCIDPLTAAAEFIAVIRSDIARRLAPAVTHTFGFGIIRGGSQDNQIPDELVLKGGFRVFSDDAAKTINAAISDRLRSLTINYRLPDAGELLHTEFVVSEGYPVVVNDPQFTAATTELLRGHLQQVQDDMPLDLGGEDFSRYLQKVKGIFMFLGTRNTRKGIVAVNHSNRFDIDEDSLACGVEAYRLLVQDIADRPEAYGLDGLDG